MRPASVAPELDPRLAAEIRGSFLLAAPLLARLGRAVLPPPGGDKIGRRRLDTHLLALTTLGARVDPQGHATTWRSTAGSGVPRSSWTRRASPRPRPRSWRPCLASGTTHILNAASEPHVQGLCRALNGMGAGITGIGTNALMIDGVEGLGGVRHRLSPDHVDLGSFVAIARQVDRGYERVDERLRGLGAHIERERGLSVASGDTGRGRRQTSTTSPSAAAKQRMRRALGGDHALGLVQHLGDDLVGVHRVVVEERQRLHVAP